MLLTGKLVYEKLNKSIGINHVRKLMASGEIKSTMIQNKWVTTEEHLNNYVQRIHLQAKENAELMQAAFEVARGIRYKEK